MYSMFDNCPKFINSINRYRWNKQYWKIPLVYGIIAIPTATYIYNNDMYKKTKFAYEAKFKEAAGDASDVAKIDPLLATNYFC